MGKLPSEHSMLQKDVHTSHCCVHHGCKYGEGVPYESIADEDPVSEPFIICSVVSGRRIQEYLCEDCKPIPFGRWNDGWLSWQHKK
jgi:hypothetical protein